MKLKGTNKIVTFIPADVPEYNHQTFVDNVSVVTRGMNRLFMFAADQKIEHLNNDFYGAGIHPDAHDPEHIFRIASQGSVGALATHPGLIVRYGHQYPDINYIVKLNGKTNLHDQQVDPMSELLYDIADVIDLSDESKLSIRGVGYTVYLGGAYEHIMLNQAARIVTHAHNIGLIAVLWIYIRAHHIKNSELPELIAGAAGLGNALGADFVKVHVPEPTTLLTSNQALKIAAQAAGNTGVICSGGPAKSEAELLGDIYEQIHQGGARGCAIGRNIFQRSLTDAVALTHAISALVYQDAALEEALKIVKK